MPTSQQLFTTCVTALHTALTRRAGGGTVPPFDRAVSIAPAESECVLFPPWLVHSVPAGPVGEGHSARAPVHTAAVPWGESAAHDELVRVSFSFNLLGRWEHTARVRAE